MPDQEAWARSYPRRPRSRAEAACVPAQINPHAALAIALALAAFIGLLFPLTVGGRSLPGSAEGGTSVLILADGLTYALDTQAQTVAGALTEAGIPLDPQDTVLRDGVTIHPTAALRPPPAVVAEPHVGLGNASGAPTEPLVIRLQRAVPLTVHEEGVVLSLRSSQATVGQALAAAGVQLGPADVLRPSPETPLSANLHVYVRHANAVQLTLGNQTRQVYTFAQTARELLQQQGVVVYEGDGVDPGLDAPISNGLKVTVTRVRLEAEVTEELLEHRVVYRDAPDLEVGQAQVEVYGQDGYVRRQYRVRYENGQEVSREKVSQEWISPVTQVIVRGTKIVPKQLVLDDGTVVTYTRALEMYATWYNAASSGGDGVTATGLLLDVGVVAVDPRVIPLGSLLYIPGYGFAVAADTGGAVRGYMIDLGYPGDTRGWCCTGRITVYVLE